jgi:hypothetical protein
MGGGLRGGVDLRQGQGRLYEETHRLTGDDTIVLFLFIQTFCCSTVNVFLCHIQSTFFFVEFLLTDDVNCCYYCMRVGKKEGCWGQ